MPVTVILVNTQLEWILFTLKIPRRLSYTHLTYVTMHLLVSLWLVKSIQTVSSKTARTAIMECIIRRCLRSQLISSSTILKVLFQSCINRITKAQFQASQSVANSLQNTRNETRLILWTISLFHTTCKWLLTLCYRKILSQMQKYLFYRTEK